MPAERSNGLRIPLVIDGTLLIVGIITATLLYGDVNRLNEYADDVSESRVTAIEKDIEFIKDAQAQTAADVRALRNELEASQREILEAIERLENGE